MNPATQWKPLLIIVTTDPSKLYQNYFSFRLLLPVFAYYSFLANEELQQEDSLLCPQDNKGRRNERRF